MLHSELDRRRVAHPARRPEKPAHPLLVVGMRLLEEETSIGRDLARLKSEQAIQIVRPSPSVAPREPLPAPDICDPLGGDKEAENVITAA
jgi:hypothetical protein